ncbi:hypothetical protein VKT23_005883 [Stygiomarasmius scandens]|uniref:Uncharacterized protein n=1 Tax=Marasmiellus scandens TaxID=2682957 RepID=A0ABR1JPI1_9AGAR
MPLSSADEYYINMTTRQVLDRADLPISSVEDLHPPPLLPVPYFGHNDPCATAKMWILTRTALVIAERVFQFLRRVGPAHDGHRMEFDMWDEEHNGDVTLSCSCGVFRNFGTFTWLEDMNFEVLLGTWEREEKVLQEHVKRIEHSAELRQEFYKFIQELTEQENTDNSAHLVV